MLSRIIAGSTGEHRVSARTASYLRASKRLFAHEGGSPSRYIAERRFELAHRLLSSPYASGLDVSEVAYRYGYLSQAHFAWNFKARYGRTSSEVR
ncbi:helix-turn-helix domain-containing protein [Metapseudomonas otitidis]|uniref:helix-turn-helix domain-containing protein n=1 Tax=Metapseudomonas otitidis TaxID=319939 RepID=UPI00280B5F3E|nr:helix-turn-helix domain-containing protein [Pseudomonas otitidis]